MLTLGSRSVGYRRRPCWQKKTNMKNSPHKTEHICHRFVPSRYDWPKEQEQQVFRGN